MKQEMNCQEVKGRIAGLSDGWLDHGEVEQIAEHINRCADCHKEAELDLRLADAIAKLEESSVPAMRWEPKPQRKPLVWRLAWLSPVAVGMALFALLWRPGNLPVVPSDVAAVSAESQALDHTHMALTLSDGGSDPNRAILAAFTKKPDKEQAQ
jgi:hypothetical protein